MSATESSPTVQQQYAKAHAAHYSSRKLLEALRGYYDIISSYPTAAEAAYSRTQIQNIVVQNVPVEKLLRCHMALVVGHLQSAGASLESATSV